MGGSNLRVSLLNCEYYQLGYQNINHIDHLPFPYSG